MKQELIKITVLLTVLLIALVTLPKRDVYRQHKHIPVLQKANGTAVTGITDYFSGAPIVVVQ